MATIVGLNFRHYGVVIGRGPPTVAALEGERLRRALVLAKDRPVRRNGERVISHARRAERSLTSLKVFAWPWSSAP